MGGLFYIKRSTIFSISLMPFPIHNPLESYHYTYTGYSYIIVTLVSILSLARLPLATLLLELHVPNSVSNQTLRLARCWLSSPTCMTLWRERLEYNLRDVVGSFWPYTKIVSTNLVTSVGLSPPPCNQATLASLVPSRAYISQQMSCFLSLFLS